jgi:hypothetical protein
MEERGDAGSGTFAVRAFIDRATMRQRLRHAAFQRGAATPPLPVASAPVSAIFSVAAW